MICERKGKKGKSYNHPGLLPEGTFGTVTQKRGKPKVFSSHSELRRQKVEFRTVELTGLGTVKKKTVKKDL